MDTETRSIMTHEDVQRDLEDIFRGIRDESIQLKKASEMNNTVGKWLKADALKLAWEHFRADRPQPPLQITHQ